MCKAATLNQIRDKGTFLGHKNGRLPKGKNSSGSNSKTSSPKGGQALAIRKPSVNVGGAVSSPSAIPKKRKAALNTGSNSGGSSGVGANLNV